MFVTESSGPLFHTSFDLTYNYDELWMYGGLLPVKPGTAPRGGRKVLIDARQMAEWLELRKLALPPSLGRVHQADSHDTKQTTGLFNRQIFGETGQRLVFAWCAFLDGGLMNFTGAEQGLEEQYKAILAVRDRHRALTAGDIDYLGAEPSNNRVFAPIRRTGTEWAMPVLSFSAAPLTTTLQLRKLRLKPGAKTAPRSLQRRNARSHRPGTIARTSRLRRATLDGGEMSTTRRGFMAGAGAATAAPALTKTRRPNVLFIISDQWSPLASDLSGTRPMPRTPAADSIAASGVRFENSYCSWPLCSPSRASLFTGQMPHTTRVIGNVRRPGIVPASMPVLGEIFSRAGYATGYFGKEHTGGAAYRGFQNLGTYQYPGAGYLADGSGLDPIFTRDAIEFIRGPRSNPFLAVLSFINPHDICYTPSHAKIAGKSFVDVNQAFHNRKGKFFRNLDFPPPRPNLNPRPPERMARVSAVQENWSEEDWRLYLATYYLLIENTDWMIGLALDAVRRAGLERDTLVLFTSDHGDQMGAHHLVGKGVFYEECMRVPFAAAWPGVINASQVNRTALISGTDVLPTICDFAGLNCPEGLDGKSVRPLLNGNSAPWRDVFVAELNEGRMLRTGDRKYMLYNRGGQRAEFLFNLRQDPGETRDLAPLAEAAGEMDRCRGLLERWMERTGGGFDRTKPEAR